MKSFRSLVVVKQPMGVTWTTVRDRLAELAPMVDDVDSITVLEREELAGGHIRMVNEWRATQRVPQLFVKALGASEIGWTDTNEWNPETMVCSWSIRPSVLTDHIDCHGTTSYEPAMAGRGTRVNFEGNFDMAPGALSGLAATLERPIGAFVESIVSTMIPKNSRKVIEAAALLAAAEGSS